MHTVMHQDYNSCIWTVPNDLSIPISILYLGFGGGKGGWRWDGGGMGEVMGKHYGQKSQHLAYHSSKDPGGKIALL